MRKNPIRSAIERGNVQIGTWITMVSSPGILPLLKSTGLDFVRVDMEHTSMSLDTIADMAVVARALDFPLVVRPPVANREWITRLLDIGVWNLHCPQVETAQQAAEIVRASRYAPMGLRGNGGLSAATDFERIDNAGERRAHANRQVFVTVMLETGEAFEHLDEIASMDGIDAITLGPADLAQDLGVSGTSREEVVLDEKRALILEVAKKHGKACAMFVSNSDRIQYWKASGASLLVYSSDVEMLYGGFSSALADFRK